MSAGPTSHPEESDRRRRRISLAGVLALIGAIFAVILQATQLGETIAGWFTGDDDSGRVVAVDLASPVSLGEAADSVSPVRECFDVAAQPKIIVRRGPGWPPLAAVRLFAQVPDETPADTPSPSPTPTGTPTETPTETPATVTPAPSGRVGMSIGDTPGSTVKLDGDDVEVVTTPRTTATPGPEATPTPPPADADGDLVDGAAQNVMVFPQSYSRAEIERLTPQVRVGPPRGGKRQPEGQLIDVEVRTTGFEDRCVYARWSLYRRLRGGGKRHVPEQWALNRAAMFLRPDSSPADGSGQFWVPLPKKRRTHFVRVALFDDTGNRLGQPKESPRFR